MINKKNLPLVLGLSLPLVMILVIAISIYLPSFFVHPKYNFLYADNSNYEEGSYMVSDSKLVIKPKPTPYYDENGELYNEDYYTKPEFPQLYVHNPDTNESRPLTYIEAANLNLDSNQESPDGFELEDGRGSGGFFPFYWGGGSDYSPYLVGNGLSKKLNLKSDDLYYDSDFLGWITN